jgi:toxin ParE1/3/4
MVTYKLQPEAEKGLENIWHHIAGEWGTAQAMQYIDDLDDAFKLLAKNPRINRLRTEFQPAIRIHLFKKHLIVYISYDDPLIIVRVLHAHMNVSAQLEQ